MQKDPYLVTFFLLKDFSRYINKNIYLLHLGKKLVIQYLLVKFKNLEKNKITLRRCWKIILTPLCDNPLPTFLPPPFPTSLLLSLYVILLWLILTYVSGNNHVQIKVLCLYQKYHHEWKYWTNIWELLYTK